MDEQSSEIGKRKHTRVRNSLQCGKRCSRAGPVRPCRRRLEAAREKKSDRNTMSFRGGLMRGVSHILYHILYPPKSLVF